MVSRYGTSAASCCCIASTIAVAPPIIVRSRFMMLMSSDGACVCLRWHLGSERRHGQQSERNADGKKAFHQAPLQCAQQYLGGSA